MDAFDGFDVAFVVMALEADDDFEVFLVGFFSVFDDGAHAFCVSGDGFFHEDVFAFFDGVFEVHGTEAWRGGEDDDVSGIDGCFVGFEADELAFFGDVDAVFVLLFESAEAGFHVVFEGVSDGDEFCAWDV